MNKTICTRIESARKALGLSQGQLAKRVQVSRQTITNYETGCREPSFNMLEDLADALNVSFSYLVGGTDDPTPRPHILYADDEGEHYSDGSVAPFTPPEDDDYGAGEPRPEPAATIVLKKDDPRAVLLWPILGAKAEVNPDVARAMHLYVALPSEKRKAILNMMEVMTDAE